MSNAQTETTSPKLPNERIIRNAYAVITLIVAAIIPTVALFGYIGFSNNEPRLLIIVGVLLVIAVIDFIMVSLIRRGRSNLAMSIVMTNFLIVVTLTIFFTQGLGVIAASATILTIMGISGLALSPKYTIIGTIAGILSGIALFFLDGSLANNRIAVTQLEAYTPYILGVLAIGFAALLVRDFNKFSLRVKITMGILLTGAITVGVLVAFGLNRSQLLTNYLLNQYRIENSQNLKQEIQSKTSSAAIQTNELFSTLRKEVKVLSAYRASLENQNGIFGQGAYWDAKTRLFQLPGGQYGNLATDPSSIFIPSTISINEDIITSLNTTAYFDFYALNYLNNHPEITSVYFISKTGATTYYPNINLANNVPPDFDPRTQAFYTISDPASGSLREPHWVKPYQDPAGQGLLITISSPVYANNTFIGIMGIDIQLKKFLEGLGNFKIGEAGYAFLVDGTGRIISMPAEGYTLFGLQEEEVAVNQSPQQTIIGKGSPNLQNTIERMINGYTSIETIQSVENETLYIAFAPLTTPNYRLGFVVAEKEFTAGLIASENESQRQIQSALQSISIILISLFIGGMIISLVIGQIIANPLIRLTQIVETISEGNLSARANINTEDETGILARSFNTMAERLSESVINLEKRVSERTRELEKANEGNARRAAQFESVAHVARTISSTQTLDALLPQITETISAEFNFYHVGIFLLDNHREFAILVAANSEGGKRMLARNHRLQVGETGIVGYATNVGQPRVALDVGQDATYFNNPDLPNTHSEIALPLGIGAEIFGALDVQSTEINAFSQEDISILSILADQVSIAIKNARSYQQSNEALALAESVSLQLSGQQWKKFLTNQTSEGYYFDGINTKAVSPSDRRREHNLAIPLILRGTQIGSIKLSSLDANREWTDDEISMIEAAAERTALALDNARLLLESQKRASKERTIGEITAKISSSVNIESILQIAIQELGKTLPGVDVAVQFTDTPVKR